MERTLNRTILYILYALKVILAFIMTSNIVQAQEIENYYEATFEYNNKKLILEGESTYAQFPLMFSFYLERNGSVSCGIHIMNREGLIEAGEYEIGADKDPHTYVICVRQDEEVSERITSTSGKFIIEEIKDDVIIGKYYINMIGGITSTDYRISGIFTAFDIKNKQVNYDREE